MKRRPWLSVISGAFLISGTTIGAGMLGIPLLTGAAGFFPAAVITTLVWLFMYLTGLAFLEATLWLGDGNNILSLSATFLGKGMRFIAGFAFAFLYYALMIAYFAGGGPLLGEAIGSIFNCHMPIVWSLFIFGLLFGSIVGIGPKWIDRTNILLTVVLVLTWIILIGVGSGGVDSRRLIPAFWSQAPFAAPVLFSAFGYHNIIPSLASYLKRDRKVLKRCILVGSLISLVVYLVWQWLVIGTLTTEQLLAVKKQGLPVTVAMARVTHSPSLAVICNAFALFAIITSTLGVSFSLIDFLGDGFRKKNRSGWTRVFLTVLTFMPPFIIASINPHIFDSALGIAGGFGEAFLNGLLPVLLVWFGHRVYKKPLHLVKKKSILVLLGLVAILVMILEILELSH